MSKLGKKMIAAVEEGIEIARGTSDPCPACGLNRVIVGRAHNCRPRLTTSKPSVSLTPEEPSVSLTLGGTPSEGVAPTATSLGQKSEVAIRPSDKGKRAPAGSFDRKAYQREYMRKRRTKV